MSKAKLAAAGELYREGNYQLAHSVLLTVKEPELRDQVEAALIKVVASLGVSDAQKDPIKSLPSSIEDWLHSDQLMALLSIFVEPHDADLILRYRPELRFDQNGCRNALKAFWEAGLLAPSSIMSQMQTYFDIARLRELLAEHKLPRTGKKIDMIARLIDADPEGIKAAIPGHWLECTEQGRALAQRYQSFYTPEIRAAKAQRLAESANYFRAIILRHRQAGVEDVRIQSVNDSYVCPLCKALANSIWPIDECPPLPHKGCTSDMGCRCYIT